MKKFILPIIALTFVSILFTSCGQAAKAEKTVEQFYDMLKSEDYSKTESLLDEDALAINPIEDWVTLLENKESLGTLESFTKDMGFNTSIHDGITEVVISYTCDYSGTSVYEQFKLVDRGSGFKIYTYEYNLNESSLSDLSVN
ncbi:MAG: hypothetical protein QNK23_11925 [Crocinitomicaceae bacterium]|nr:hypothetical protein [Crocinitomicaceae bacterium]